MTRENTAWAAGGIGVLGCTLGWIVAPQQFPHAWLAAVTGWIGWPLGSLALILIHTLTGGRWGWVIRPQLVAGVTTLMLLLPACVPVLLVLRQLYPWTHEEVDASFYLNMPFFYLRGVTYLIVWFGVGGLALRALGREDPEPILQRLAPPGLILLALTATFAAFDFTLSMDPHFRSSIYGMLVCAEGVLLALSIAVLGVTLGAGTDDIEDLGKLLLGLLLLWAYLDFMQMLIIWQSDLPDEAGWYIRRTTGGWAIVGLVVAGLHIILPFFALLWPQVQRSRRAMMGLAALLVAMEVPRAWWIVLPFAGRGVSWVDLAAMLAIFGLGAGLAIRAPRLWPAQGAYDAGN
jgi:hypothetical protein